mgnify:CR=1 FL=1
MKKLIFCFDGTCNSPTDADDYINDASITNILKLHLLFGGTLQQSNCNGNILNQVHSKKIPQQSFYYSGIGTRGNWLKKIYNSAFAPAYGEMKDILAEANNDIAKNYTKGDEIYIFGFSRGAAIARVFAAHLMKPIKFLGVFDTVAATKGSLDLNPATFPASGIIFENDILATHVEQAVHILALDEQRLAFQPTLFNKDDRIQEVWFAGSHSDIGGGYWFDGLSDLCLQFMLDSLQGRLDILSVDDITCIETGSDNLLDVIDHHDLQIKPLVNGKLHTQQRSLSKSLTLAPRLVRVNVNNDSIGSSYLPLVHYSVAERCKQVANYKPVTLLNKHYQLLNKDNTLSEAFSGINDLVFA